ncbi:rubrerythrin [Acidobacteria bacterium AB60]|nr:rubrerythrin [Acidobacteria bacterium AB60]
MPRIPLLNRAWTVLAVLAFFPLAPAIKAESTLVNLQEAYNGESNAEARYTSFAQRADTDGYPDVANLFRAAARAEQIHAQNHAQVIKRLGGHPVFTLGLVEVRSTRENLQAAIKGESYERDTMYPNFLKQAREDGDAQAVRTFNLAKAAEAEHAKLYQAALDNLERSKGVVAGGYYVCPVCGFTSRTRVADRCPSCFTSKERFEKVA